MTTYYSEDNPDRDKQPDEVAATPVEGLDREPEGNKATAQAKVVEAPKKAAAKKSAAKVTTKSQD